MLPVTLFACAAFLLSAGMGASADAPEPPKMKPSRTHTPEIEEMLGVILDLVDEARENSGLTTDWPKRRVFDVYAPVSCDLPAPDFVVDRRWGRWKTPRTSFQVDGREIFVGSAEFEAMTIQVHPELGIPMSCDEKGCEVILPANAYLKSYPVVKAMLTHAGFLREPRIVTDECRSQLDWCTQTGICDNKGKEALYYRQSDRLRVDVAEVQLGRPRGSLKLKFVRDSDPYCDPFALQMTQTVLPFCPPVNQQAR